MNDAFELTDVEIPIDGVLDANAIAKAEAEFTSLLDYLNNPSQELTDFLATPEGQSYSTDMDMYIQTLEEILNELSNIGALEMSNPVDVELALMKILDIMQLNDTFFAPLYRTFQTRNAIAAAPRPRLTTADISTAQNIITQNGTRSLVTINASDSNDYTTININYINRLAALDTLVTTTVDDLLIREEDGRRKSSLPQNTPVILTGERKIMTITNNGIEANLMYFQVQNSEGEILGYVAGCYLQGPDIPATPPVEIAVPPVEPEDEEDEIPPPTPPEDDEENEDEEEDEIPPPLEEVMQRALTFNNGTYRAIDNATLTRDYLFSPSQTEPLPSRTADGTWRILYLTTRMSSTEKPEFSLLINESDPDEIAIAGITYSDGFMTTRHESGSVLATATIASLDDTHTTIESIIPAN